MAQVELSITGREKVVGGIQVQRILPYATRRMVGPFIFLDHIGPTRLDLGSGLDVGPHPHIGLATVTYFFDGGCIHRDSLGSHQLIVPGDINWMTAGRGILHSERTPAEDRGLGGVVHGIQCWVALPSELEDMEPSFFHYGSQELPEFEMNSVRIKLLLGKALNRISPVKVSSDLFYLELKFPKGARFSFPSDGREAAVYVVDGKLQIEDKVSLRNSMAIVTPGEDLQIEALEESHAMLLGGAPVGKRFIYWNFVASTTEKLEAAKEAWSRGPTESGRFTKIPGDDSSYIPLPPGPNPKGTIL